MEPQRTGLQSVKVAELDRTVTFAPDPKRISVELVKSSGIKNFSDVAFGSARSRAFALLDASCIYQVFGKPPALILPSKARQPRYYSKNDMGDEKCLQSPGPNHCLEEYKTVSGYRARVYNFRGEMRAKVRTKCSCRASARTKA